MQDSTHRRRFIAGAVCPQCALLDRIMVDLDTDRRLCVSCGFSEARPGLPAATSQAITTQPLSELPTRVSRAAARRMQTPAQVIALIETVGDPAEPKG